MKTIEQLHTMTVECSKQYLASERDLLSLLMELDSRKAFHPLGHAGMFSYCMNALGFSESQASYFCSVARKSKEVPALKQAIDSGVLSISKARRITSVITPETQSVWIERAATLPQRELEREVATVNPQAVRERMKTVDFHRHEIRLGLSDESRKKLERAISLVSRKKGKLASMEETMDLMLDHFLKIVDPVKKEERTVLRKVRPAKLPKGRALPANVRHSVNLRDQGKCQVKGCGLDTWTQVHHRKPYAQGGKHSVENLVTLCSAHHAQTHHSECCSPAENLYRGDVFRAKNPNPVDKVSGAT